MFDAVTRVLSTVFRLVEKHMFARSGPLPDDEANIPMPNEPAGMPTCWFDTIERSLDREAAILKAKGSNVVNWRQSIVDLLTILGEDSSLASRRQLAVSMGYTGDLKDTATMNTWLIEQTMDRLKKWGHL